MIIVFTVSSHTFPVVFHVLLHLFILLERLSNHSNCVPTKNSSRIHWSVKSTGGTRLFIRGLLVEAPGGVQICTFSVLLPGVCFLGTVFGASIVKDGESQRKIYFAERLLFYSSGLMEFLVMFHSGSMHFQGVKIPSAMPVQCVKTTVSSSRQS